MKSVCCKYLYKVVVMTTKVSHINGAVERKNIGNREKILNHRVSA
jgi:hypothetical protein